VSPVAVALPPPPPQTRKAIAKAPTDKHLNSFISSSGSKRNLFFYQRRSTVENHLPA
jgi:hypothetical protein